MNIFDLENIEDVPKKLKYSLRQLRASEETQKLMSLFEIKDILTVDELVVGMFRKYNKVFTRSWITATAYNLARRKIIKRIGLGKYKIISNFEGI